MFIIFLLVPDNIPPATKLVDFIRHHAHEKGTKYMCREAGCGACIVAVKRLNRLTNKTEWLAINSVGVHVNIKLKQ